MDKGEKKMFKCDLAGERNQDGFCKYKRGHCDGNGYVAPNTECEVINKKDMCKEGSPYGNYHIGLTDDQIELLKNGEVLAVLDEEYNIFIERTKNKMPRYIEANSAIKMFKGLYGGSNASHTLYDASQVIDFIKEQPTADVQKIKHGKWNAVESNVFFHCSSCGGKSNIMFNFCPNCGARMDGVTENK